ncbi:MalM family protein [uncultured Vibrio sp.]|uniref:MalM family protein n=1 Tax=uncultured Vibrio sp. TaxID=114054 RepID=UPI0025F230D7|nr:MalM family protein [uncultured Vibrio sp.]
MRSSLLLVSSIGLFGCASTSMEAPNIAPINESICCTSESEYPWISLDRTQSLDFDIDESSPVGAFQPGKSHFSAFAFNEQSKKVDILIRSNMQDRQVIIPRVDLLNERFELVKTIESDQFDIVFSDALAKNRFELKSQVDAEETPYFILYADVESLGEKVVVPHPAIVRAQESGEPMPIVTNPTYLSSTTGQFSIEIETKTLSGYFKKQTSSGENTTHTPRVNPELEPLSQAQQDFYLSSIENAVSVGMLDKALALLDEAKSLNVEGAQEAFIKAVNASK